MKAIIYGPSATLEVTDVDKPVPGDGELLVRVRAASVNPLDGHFLKASPFVRRLLYRLMGVKTARPGADIAGVVEAVGPNVTRVSPGDEVFGSSGGGGFAEYACPPECTALQGLREVEPGQTLLINGASGGVGTFAVQIAKWIGADVTAVCSTKNVDMVRELGADRLIDYTIEDFTSGGIKYDVIYDLVGDKSFSELSRTLKPTGRYIGAGVLSNEGSMLKVLPAAIYTSLRSIFSKQKFTSLVAKVNKDDLASLAQLLQTGKIEPVIDRTYPLEQTADAVRYVAAKHARGKVVIVIS